MPASNLIHQNGQRSVVLNLWTLFVSWQWHAPVISLNYTVLLLSSQGLFAVTAYNNINIGPFQYNNNYEGRRKNYTNNGAPHRFPYPTIISTTHYSIRIRFLLGLMRLQMNDRSHFVVSTESAISAIFVRLSHTLFSATIYPIYYTPNHY